MQTHELIDLAVKIAKLIIFSIVFFANAWAIIGFHRATQYDTEDNGDIKEDTKMILWKVKYYSDKYMGVFWSKPVYACPACMGSLHGITPFLITESLVNGFSGMTVLYWAFYTFALSGVATFINEK